MRQEGIAAAKEGPQYRQVEREPAVDAMIGQTAEGDDAEEFAGANIMPMQHREQRTVIAMVGIAQHAAKQAHVRELGQALRLVVAFIEDVLGLDVEAKLRRDRDAFGNGRVQPVQAIQQQNLVSRQLDAFGGSPAAFLETVNRFLNRLALEQPAEMAIEQLDVQCFRRFVVAVVDPIGGMLDKRPEIVVEVEHEETQALFLQALGQLDGGGGFAGGTRAADPHHAKLVAGVETRHDLVGGLIQRTLVNRERFLHQRLDFPAPDDLVQTRHRAAPALMVPEQRVQHLRRGKAIPDNLFRRDGALAQPMPAPAITRVGVGGVLEAITAQRMKHLVLDRLDGGREIRDQVMRIGIEADHHGLSEEPGDFVIGAVGLEDFVVDAGPKILPETAQRFGRAQERSPNPGFIEFDQGSIALLDLDDAVLDGHEAPEYAKG